MTQPGEGARMRICEVRDIRPDGRLLSEWKYAEPGGFSPGYLEQPAGPWERQWRMEGDNDWRVVGGRNADGSWWTGPLLR